LLKILEEVTLVINHLLPISLDEKLSPDNQKLIKNFGYAAASTLYHALEIDYFINNRRPSD